MRKVMVRLAIVLPFCLLINLQSPAHASSEPSPGARDASPGSLTTLAATGDGASRLVPSRSGC
jgi:hypothetical protein